VQFVLGQALTRWQGHVAVFVCRLGRRPMFAVLWLVPLLVIGGVALAFGVFLLLLAASS
jgi:hypothetical protein